MTAETPPDVNTSTREQLLVYAKTELGLKVDASIKKAELVDLISKQTGQPVEAAGPAPESGPQEKLAAKELRKQPKVKIRIHENPAHPPRIPVEVNGVQITIVPGAVVEVPAPYVEVLRNAITTTYAQVRDDRGNLKTVQRQGLQFPFEVVQ